MTDEYFEVVSVRDPAIDIQATTPELMRKYANDGATVGFRHGGPVYISVGRSFIEQAMGGAAAGVSHAG